MKAQMTFGDMEYAECKRSGRRETFLRKMDALIPWAELAAVIQPHYYPGKRGRPPVGIETMLCMYFLQLWYSMSDEMTEESIYDSRTMKEFMGIGFHDADAPDATTLLNFRHLLERNGLQKKLFDTSSRTFSGTARRATAGWRRTGRGCTCCSGSRTCTGGFGARSRWGRARPPRRPGGGDLPGRPRAFRGARLSPPGERGFAPAAQNGGAQGWLHAKHELISASQGVQACGHSATITKAT